MVLNPNRFKVYEDPTFNLPKKNLKLKWPEKAYYCDENGEIVDSEELANPDFDPWLRFSVKRYYGEQIDFSVSYDFLYHPSTRKAMIKKVSLETVYRELNVNSKFYKILEEKIIDLEPCIAPLKGMPGSGLDTGYVYAPYIPVLKSPTIDPTDFSLRKNIISRFAKKVVNPKYYGVVNVKNL